MSIRVQAPDGTIIEFPDGTPDQEINRVMREEYRPQPIPGGIEAGGNAPAPGFAVGAAAGEAFGTQRSPGYRAAYAREQRTSDPEARRRAAGMPRIPVLDDISDVIGNAPASLGIADEAAGFRARGGQTIENVIRRMQGRPIEITADEAGDAAADEQNDRYARFRRERPNLATGADVMSFAQTLGTPAGGPVSAVRAGLGAMAIDTPFAFGRQEGDLQDRVPGAAREIATTGIFSAGLQGLANRLTRGPTPRGNGQPRARQRAQDFADAGVRPTLAATNQGAAAGATKLISENFVAGGGVRRRLQDSIDDTAAGVRRMAERYGEALPRRDAGEQVQAGVQRFARGSREPRPSRGNARSIPVREWSFPAKARALYDDVFGRLADEESRMIGQVEGPLLITQATQRTFNDILSRVHGPASRQVMHNEMIERIQRALSSDEALGELRFRDLREWRSWVRRAQRDEGLRQGIDQADLQRLEHALSDDIYASARSIGGQAADDLQRVDRWYRSGSERIQRALQQFSAGPQGRTSGPQTFQRIIAAASQRSENTRALAALRSSLRPDEWRVVAASVIDELGHPLPGAANSLEPDAFSVARFGTRYADLTERGRNILFGGQGRSLRDELDALARVAKYQEGVERMANHSRSGTVHQNIAMLGGAMTNAPLTLAALSTMAITGEMLTNPAFVRWLTSVSRSGGGVGGMRRHLAALAQLASRDPALAPLYDELVQRVEQQVRGPAPQSGAPQEQQRPQLEAVP